MKFEAGDLVPIITHSEHPYMAQLYEDLGASKGDDPQLILDCAEAAWQVAKDRSDRVQAIELLMGRRIDGMETHTLPFELVASIFEGGPFEIAYKGVGRAIQIGEA
jgi:hypothetical protein